MKMPNIKKCGVLVATLLLSFSMTACASMFTGGARKPVTIGSEPPGQEFVVRDYGGIIHHKGVTPATVRLLRSSGSFEGATYIVESGGKSIPIDTKITGAAWLNVFSLMFGFVIDGMTGALYTPTPRNIVFYN